MGYPATSDELALLQQRLDRAADEVSLQAILEPATVLGLQAAVEQVHVAPSIVSYVVALVAATRASTRLEVGASPRGSLALLKMSRARAALRGRDYVVPEDVKAVAIPTLAHRLILRPELWVQRLRAEVVVQECLDSVPTPPAEEPA
jgi:MoxR-like ATPase